MPHPRHKQCEYRALTRKRCRARRQHRLHPAGHGPHLRLPSAFDGYVERTVRVSSTCLISVARNRYSVPCERVVQWVSSRLYPSRVVVVADEKIIASHERLFDRDQVSYDWQHYIPLISCFPRYDRSEPMPVQDFGRLTE